MQRFGAAQAKPGRATTALLVALAVIVVAVVALLVVMRLERRSVTLAGTARAPTGARMAPAPSNVGAAGDAAATPSAQSASIEGCPPDGDGGDRALNRLKNRAEPATPRDTPFDSVLVLPVPEGIGSYRTRWPKRAAAAVSAIERRSVRVEAFVARASLSGPESTNCHGDASAYRDFHIWLTGAPTADRTRSVIAEMTPRMRARHAGWTLAGLRDVSRRKDRVRVAGWLLLDQEHPEQVGRTRGTIWEIHPVSGLEVFRGGRWIALDDLPQPRGGR